MKSQAEVGIKLPEVHGRAALGVGEFARAIGVSAFTVHRRIKSGKLRIVRFGRRVLIPATELERVLDGGGQQ